MEPLAKSGTTLAAAAAAGRGGQEKGHGVGEGDGGVDAAGTTGVHHLGFECWQVYELLVHLPASMLQVDLRVDHTTTNRFLPLARALERLGEPLHKMLCEQCSCPDSSERCS